MITWLSNVGADGKPLFASPTTPLKALLGKDQLAIGRLNDQSSSNPRGPGDTQVRCGRFSVRHYFLGPYAAL